MTPNPQRAEPTATLKDYVDPPAEPEISPSFDPYTWQESQEQSEFHGAGGRQVLGSALVILAANF